MILKFVFGIFAVSTLFSCKKDYTCECAEGAPPSYTTYILHDTKDNAERHCKEKSSYFAVVGARTCSLK